MKKITTLYEDSGEKPGSVSEDVQSSCLGSMLMFFKLIAAAITSVIYLPGVFAR